MFDVDVVIVGAGLSGACAARRLEKEGLSVVVLEATDRVGGRLYTLENEHVGYVDMGGAYVGPFQHYVHQLIKELGLKTYALKEEGDCVVYKEGRLERVPHDSKPAESGLVTRYFVKKAFRELGRMIKQVPVLNPWDISTAKLWDSMTLSQWCDTSLWTKTAREEVIQMSRQMVCVEGYQVSLLYLLWSLKASGFGGEYDSRDGGLEQTGKLVGGAQQLVTGVVRELKGDVHCGQAVSKISYDDQGCTVTTHSGRAFRSRYVVLAIAHTMHSRISFEPPLPSARRQLSQRFASGASIKTYMFYAKPYWKEKGFSGTILVQDCEADLPVGIALDDTKPDGSYPSLVGFIHGEKAIAMSRLTKEQRRDRIAACYKKLFGIDEMEHPLHYEEKDWRMEPWVSGSYTPPGTLSQLGQYIRAPIGNRIFLAGTDAAMVSPGFMDGAIDAGYRAARQILHSMGKLEASEVWTVAEEYHNITHGATVQATSEQKRWLPKASVVLVASLICVAASIATVTMKRII